MRKYSGYTTDLITDKASEVLRGRPKEKPFCLLVHHKAPHRNFMPNVTHLEEFADTEFPLPPTFHDDYEGRPAAEHADMRIEDMFLSFDLKLKPWAYEEETGTGGNAEFAEQAPEMLAQAYNRMTKEQKEVWDSHYDKVSREFRESDLTGRALSEWKYQRYIRDYLRCVRSVDENVERLLDYLDQEELAQNTLVIYTSDQGFYLGEHGWYDKRFMYEESLRTPLVMRFPQEVAGGLVKDNMVLNLDLAPTILDFAGISPPDGMQGRSLRTVAGEKPAENWRDSVYYHYYEYPHGWHDVYKHYGVRTDRYKLIHFYDDIDHWELYDLKEDPGEMTNRYSDPAYQQTLKRLKGELERLRRKFGDTTP